MCIVVSVFKNCGSYRDSSLAAKIGRQNRIGGGASDSGRCAARLPRYLEENSSYVINIKGINMSSSICLMSMIYKGMRSSGESVILKLVSDL